MTVTRAIDAPIERVFETVADINNYSKAIPGIVDVEILSDVKSGIGTRFRETRSMGGTQASTELEVTEFVENEHVRLVADSHGTIWDSIFSVKSVNGQTELTLTMEGKPYKPAAKLMAPLARGMLQKALESDMDAVKAHLET